MFESQLVKTDVTAVKLVNDRILAGTGNFLSIYTQTGKFIKKIRIFDGQKIQGIVNNNQKILLYGGCHLQTLSNQFDKLCNKKIREWILAGEIHKDLVAVVVMTNKLILCNSNLDVVRKIVCQESCILYSAFIASDQSEELVVLSGTVFGQALVWKIDLKGQRENFPVLARLEGHNGVIFSINYNKKVGYICTSSDDRSSMLWSVQAKSLHKELKNPTPKITLLRKFYGHHSRIFRCLLLDNFLLTAGEDSYINVWNFDGELLNKIATHQGGAIWAIDSDGELVVAGGGGCGVLVSHIKYEPICQRLAMPHSEVPKSIGLLNRSIVVVTETGILYCYVGRSEKWVKVAEHEDLRSYSLLEVSKCRNMVSLSGYNGDIYIYQEQDNLELRTSFKLPDQPRICSFHWLSCSTFLTCDDTGKLSLWYLQQNQLLLITNFCLPETKTWTSSACQGPNGTYIVGDRRGNIFVFRLDKKEPVKMIKKAHNHLGVTQLTSFGEKITSMGRDGTIKTYVMGENLEVFSKNKLPFSWLLRIIDDLLLAFFGNIFIVWDYKTRKTLIEHPCGGGHRSWDFQNGDQMTLTYVKERGLYVVKWDSKAVCPINIMPDYHVNIINSISVIPMGDKWVILSGSEDTTLRISILGQDFFNCIRNVKSHLSNIKSLFLHQLTKTEFLVFSGGGRGQIISWQFFFDGSNSDIRETGSYYERTKEMSEFEIRIMDLKTVELDQSLVLLSACSDGNVNVFRIDANYKLNLVTKLFHKPRCITRMLVVPESKVLVTMSSDGIFAFWNLSQLSESMAPFTTMKVHQSGVVGCRFRFINTHMGVILTGGDDGCVVLTLFYIEKDKFDFLDQFRDVASHCAQVSGTWISDGYFLTTGVDQRLFVYKWGVEEGRLKCKVVGRYNSAVADIQGMECVEDVGCFHVFLYGKGVEYVKIVKGSFLEIR